MDKKVFELDFYGRKIVVEHGQLAKQADGAVLVRYGDTVVLSTAVVSKSANLLSDFFPLMVLLMLYQNLLMKIFLLIRLINTWKDEKIHKNYLQIVKYSVLLICSLNFVIGTSYHN